MAQQASTADDSYSWVTTVQIISGSHFHGVRIEEVQSLMLSLILQLVSALNKSRQIYGCFEMVLLFRWSLVSQIHACECPELSSVEFWKTHGCVLWAFIQRKSVFAQLSRNIVLSIKHFLNIKLPIMCSATLYRNSLLCSNVISTTAHFNRTAHQRIWPEKQWPSMWIFLRMLGSHKSVTSTKKPGSVATGLFFLNFSEKLDLRNQSCHHQWFKAADNWANCSNRLPNLKKSFQTTCKYFSCNIPDFLSL